MHLNTYGLQGLYIKLIQYWSRMRLIWQQCKLIILLLLTKQYLTHSWLLFTKSLNVYCNSGFRAAITCVILSCVYRYRTSQVWLRLPFSLMNILSLKRIIWIILYFRITKQTDTASQLYKRPSRLASSSSSLEILYPLS